MQESVAIIKNQTQNYTYIYIILSLIACTVIII